MRRRVLLVAPYLFRWGLMGAGSRIMQLSKAWSAIGWDASALVCWKRSDAAQWEAFSHALPGGLINPPLPSFDFGEAAYAIGGRLSRTRLLRDTIPPPLKHKLRWAGSGRWARALERHLAEAPNAFSQMLQSVDCIWCVFTGTMDAAIAARMLATKLNKPLVVSLHDPLVTFGDVPGERAEFTKLLQFADRVVTTTETYRAILHASYGISIDAVDTIYMRFPDVQATKTAFLDFPKAGEPLRLAHCGQLHGRTGTRDILPLLKALESWPSKAGVGGGDWELHLAGIGPGLAAAEDFVRKSPFLSKRVEFHGYLEKDEAAALARRVHVNVILQGEDQFAQLPNKVFDLLPLAQPIFGIVPQGSEVHSILNESGRTFLAQPGDLAGIFASLQALADGASLRGKMEVGIPRSLLLKFSEDRLPDDLQDVMSKASRHHAAWRHAAR